MHFVLLTRLPGRPLVVPQRIEHAVHPRDYIHPEDCEFEAREEDVECRFAVVPRRIRISTDTNIQIGD